MERQGIMNYHIYLSSQRESSLKIHMRIYAMVSRRGKRRSCSLHGVEKDTVRHDGNTYRDFTVLHGIKLQTKCSIVDFLIAYHRSSYIHHSLHLLIREHDDFGNEYFLSLPLSCEES